MKKRATATEVDIRFFERNEDVLLPADLKEYFIAVNGTAGEYDEKWFCFYALTEFQKSGRKFRDWDGIPNYQDIQKSFMEHLGCYAFADYQCHLITYAIRLHKNETVKNEVYAVIGSSSKIVASSFGDFMAKYVNDSEELQF